VTWAIAAAMVAALTGPAAAAASRGPDSFAGTCEVDGVLSFEGDGIGALPEWGSWYYEGTGTCDGTLDGEAVAATPMTTRIDGVGYVGCLGSLMRGATGTLSFSRGTQRRSDDASIGFTSGTYPAALAKSAPWRAEGDVSGEFVGDTTFQVGPDDVEPCRVGQLNDVPTHISMRTVRPIVG
jgi:hypothetical protein